MSISKDHDTVRQDEAVQAAARHLFQGCAPERESELRAFWLMLDPKFQLVGETHEGERFVFDAGAYRLVRFNHRAVRAFWIGAFIAWEGYRAVAESHDIDKVDLSRMAALIVAFTRVLESDQSDLEALPDGVPEPGSFPAESTIKAPAELATMAVGWALLHEIRHIQHQQEGTGADPYGQSPEPFHTEELSCDEFATAFLLEGVPVYADDKAIDLAIVRRKRELAIYFALFTLTLLAEGKWGASLTHPAIQDRIDAVGHHMGVNRCEIAEAIAHTAFAALRTLWPGAPGVAVRERAGSD